MPLVRFGQLAEAIPHKPMDQITMDELLHAIERAEDSRGEGFTVSELVEATGIGQERIRALLRRAMKGKSVRLSRKPIIDFAGRRVLVPSYALVNQSKEKCAA